MTLHVSQTVVPQTVPLLRVESPGLLSTIQDAGRYGHQRDGLTPSGAMDPWAADVASLLCGTGRGLSVLEITLLGPALTALADVRIALCGGDLSATDDGAPLPLWKTHALGAGRTLRFGRRRSGARAYLAVAGGFAVPPVLGSRATFLRAKLGGLEGRALRAGDVLEGYASGGLSLENSASGRAPAVGLAAPPDYSPPAVLRVLPGPHDARFSDEARAVFFGSEHRVSPQSDRQGYRLDGPPVPAAGEILSEAAPFGGLQVPPDGRPILLMADRQPTGGYPLLGVVVRADLGRAGQLAPGDPVRFRPVTLAEAHRAAVAQERELRLMGYVLSRRGSGARSP